MITLTQADLKKIEKRPVVGTERGTPTVELAEWERDALCAIARVVLGRGPTHKAGEPQSKG